MDIKSLYDQLLNSEPMGFIDPFSDLGEFDLVQMKFTEPVSQLVNKYSGKPYSLVWQLKIKEMRELYIAYQAALYESDKSNFQIRRNRINREHIEDIVTTYLRLGFNFREIEQRTSLTYKQLRRGWKRSDHVATAQAEFYSKTNLTEGKFLATHKLPKSMKVN